MKSKPIDKTTAPSTEVMHVPMTVLYAACRVLLNRASGTRSREDAHLRAGLEDALESAPVNDGANSLLEQARTGMADAIVPFHRNRLDLAFAAAAGAALATPHAAHRIRGDGIYVDAGYFEVQASQANYVDQVRAYRASQPELLEHQKSEALIKRLALESRVAVPTAVSIATPMEGDDVMQITGPLVEVLATNSSRLPEFGMVEVKAQLLQLQGNDADTKAGSAPRSRRVRCAPLGSLPLTYEAHCLKLVHLKTELLMELQAAAMEGRWILLSHPSFRFLAPLPDLTEPGDIRSGWWDPHWSLDIALLGRPASVDIRLPVPLARSLLQRFHWASTREPTDWFTLAHSLVHGLKPQ